MAIKQVFQLADGSSLFLTFERGRYVVYDGSEYVHFDNAEPLYSGNYDDCLAFVKDCKDNALDAILD